MLSPDELLVRTAIGNDAGWSLTFHRESEGRGVIDQELLALSVDDYDASIEAALPDGFSAGKYTFRLEGITEGHYATLKGEDPPTVVRLHLFWRDAGAAPAPLGELQVAELSILNVRRTVGPRRYECVIDAGERVFVKARDRRAHDQLTAPNTLEMIRLLALEAGFEFAPRPGPGAASYGFNPDGSLPSLTGGAPGVDPRIVEKGTTFAQALVDLGKRIEDGMPDARGRGVLLIRNGVLVVGKRPIPPVGAPPHELTPATGFVDSEAVEPGSPDQPPGQKPARAQFKLTLKGRPDILPGDVVRFSPALEDAPTTPSGGLRATAASFLGPAVGSLPAGPEVTLYVNSVEHRLSRDSGFATALVGVVIEDGEAFTDAWDVDWSTASDPPPDARGNSGATANKTVAAARAVKDVAQAAAAQTRQPEVAEVRATHSARPGGSADEPPAQTLTVWQGLAPPDGHSGQARRLPIRREQPTPQDGVPYLSPFAWGHCGLVLPRYPGTRTLLAFRNGQVDDPIDVGALWESGHAPESEPGDWWLILPAGVPASRRDGLPDSQPIPPEHTGKATNDLIDAEGRRIVEVGELTIRVGSAELHDAGTRPPLPQDTGAITIEHTHKGSKITMRPDGTISIEAAKDLELHAPNGDITLQSVRVRVNVDGAMEVS